MKIKKLLYVILGCIGLALGAVGAVLPLLPAFPFLLLAAFCFAKSSEKLHRWFTGTKLYKNNLESYVKGHGMEDQNPDYDYRDGSNVDRLYYDACCSGGKDRSGLCLGIPYPLLCFPGKDH